MDIDIRKAELVLHIGFHKTATTFLQKTLQQNAETLLKEGIVYIPTARFREIYESRDIETYHKLIANRLKGRSLRRLIVSDENLPGTMKPIFMGEGMYPQMTNRIDEFTKWIGKPPDKTLVSIRNYVNFFPSAYVQWLRPDPFIRFDGRLYKTIVNYQRGWGDVLDDLTKALPKETICLWRYEDFSTLQPQIFEILTGLDVTQLSIEPQQKVNPSLTYEGYKAFEQAMDEGINLPQLRRFIKENQPPSGTPFRDIFWQNQDEERFSERYTKDCKDLYEKYAFLEHAP